MLAEAKQLAAERGRTFTAVIEDALREMLLRRKERPKTERVGLPRHSEGGPRPGVSLDSNADLLDLMKEAGAAD